MPHSSKKRILHFIESEGVYGAENVILNLSTQLLHTQEYTPVVGCIVYNQNSSSALYDAAVALGIEAVKIPIANARLLLDIPSAAQQIKRLNIDLIHSHGYKPSVFGFAIHLIKKISIMATCHLWFEPSKSPLKTRIMMRLEKHAYRWYPKVIGVSTPIKNILLENGLRPEQVGIIENGVDTPKYTYSPDEIIQLKQELGLKPDAFCILNTARLTRQKAQWVLIEAANLLKEVLPDIRFLIVGEGPLAQELQNQIHEKKLHDQIKLLGFRSDVDKLLAMADIFALPSIDEGMPMSLLEAAAASKPIITTHVGDIEKLITHEDTGLVIPVNTPRALADAIIKLHNSSSYAQTLANNAHKKMQRNYSSEAMSQRYQAVYSQILHTVNR